MACTGDWITKPMQSIVSKKERNRAIVESLARFIHEAAAAKWMGLDLTLAA